LRRQLNAATPGHVWISIRSNPAKALVRIWSWRWFAYGSSTALCRASERDGQRHELENICMFVQTFMSDETGCRWPSVVPNCAIDAIPFRPNVVIVITDTHVRISWEHEGRTLLALNPISL
jgi:hypothetical protein